MHLKQLITNSIRGLKDIYFSRFINLKLYKNINIKVILNDILVSLKVKLS